MKKTTQDATPPIKTPPSATQTPSVKCAFGEMADVAALIPNPRNPNKHPDSQIAMLAKVIQHQGWRSPIVVSRRSGFVVVGHGRLAAARLLKLDKVPVDRQDFATEADEWAHLVADNRLAELAELDEKEIAGILKDLSTTDLDMDLSGFDASELSNALSGLVESEVDAEPQIDRAAELQKEWKTKLGQVWQLGEHRLMCGDSTKGSEVASLMGEDRCSLCVTDPPYGVSYGDKNKFLNTIAPGNRIQTPIENDHETKEKTQAVWKAAFGEMAAVMLPGAVVYSFMPQGGDQMMMMMMMMTGAGIEPRHELIWLKNNHVLGRVDYAYKHEPIMYAWKKGGHKFYGDFQTSIIECNKPTKSDLHPTTKPVEIVAKLVANSSRPGEIVYEPFSGSGTAILACEQTSRKCRAIELSPGYVAVALQRFKDATGKTPKLL